MLFRRNGTAKSASVVSTRSKLRARSHALKWACEYLERRQLLSTVTWITQGSGDWSNGANWDSGSPPAPGDDVVIDVPGLNVTITYSGGAQLQLNNLINNELLLIQGGGATWTGGVWDGNGQIENFSTLAISGSSDKILRDGERIINLSSATLSGTGNIVGQVGAAIVNEFGATFDIQSDADITFPTGVGDGIFENAGLVKKTGGGTGPGDMTEIGGAQGFRYENCINFLDPRDSLPGDTQVLQGMLTLGDDQNVAITRGGTFEISANATLNYDRGQADIVVLRPRTGNNITPSITGAGTLMVTGGNLQHYGVFAVHEVDVSAGQFLLNQNMTEFAGTPQKNPTPAATTFGKTDILNFTGGTLGGNGAGIFRVGNINEERPALVVGSTPAIVAGNSLFNWSGGTLSGTGRLVVDLPTTNSIISTINPKAIIGGFGLDLIGETIWQGSGTITMNGNSAMIVDGSGTLWDQNDGTIVQGTVDGNGGSVWSWGNILKLGGTGTTSFGTGISFVNDANPLNFSTAAIPLIDYPVTSFGAALLAKLDIDTGTFSLAGTSINRDNILIKPGATLSYDAGTHFNQTYIDSNDVINASIIGTDGGGSINFGAAIFNSDLNALVDVPQATFGTGTYTFDNTAGGAQRIQNGVFNGQGTGIIGGAGTLEVTGTFVWNSGGFRGNNSGTSSLLIDTGATLTIPAGDRTTTNSYSIDNRGTIQWTTSPGLLDINGKYTQSSTGSLVSNIIGADPALDRLRVSGAVSLAGNLSLNDPAFGPTDGEKFTLINNTGVGPIVGTFLGIPEGKILTIGTNAFIVSYIGGDGNDLTLTALVLPAITIANPVPILEGDVGMKNLNFKVTLSQAVARDVSVDFSTGSGTATPGVDYVPTSGTLTIPAGQVTGTIAVPIIGDLIAEPNETFLVTLSNPLHGFLGTPAVATGLIVDDDGPPQISLSQTIYAVAESAGVLTIAVSRTSPAIPTSVHYSTSSDTAIAGQDYTDVSGTLNFAAGVVTLTFDVPIIDALISQGTKAFNVTLSNPQGGGATIGVGSAQVVIVDNDPPAASMSIGDATATEPISGVVDAIFTVTLSKPVVSAVTVHYTTVDGTAKAGSDYVATTGTLTFQPNQLSAQIAVPVNSDFLQESPETFSVVLSNPVGLVTLATTTGTGTILNQEVHTVIIDAQHPYHYVDSSNNVATIMLRGPGVGTLSYLGLPSNDAKAIVLNGTTSRSQFVVRTSSYQTFLVDLTVNGDIMAIDGPTLNLQHDLTVTGGLQKLRLNNLLGGNTISVGTGTGAFRTLTAMFNDVSDTSFTSALPLTSLKVDSWLDAAPAVDITAPSIGVMTCSDDFEADLTLTGDLGSLRVGGNLLGSNIHVGGNINTIVANTIADSTIFAGVSSAVIGLPSGTAQFSNSTSTINNVTVNGRSDGAFSNTNIAAPIVGNVQLGSVAVANAGVTFGIAGTSIRSVRGKNSQVIKLTNTDLLSSPFSESDLLIHLTT